MHEGEDIKMQRLSAFCLPTGRSADVPYTLPKEQGFTERRINHLKIINSPFFGQGWSMLTYFFSRHSSRLIFVFW